MTTTQKIGVLKRGSNNLSKQMSQLYEKLQDKNSEWGKCRKHIQIERKNSWGCDVIIMKHTNFSSH